MLLSVFSATNAQAEARRGQQRAVGAASAALKSAGEVGRAGRMGQGRAEQGSRRAAGAGPDGAGLPAVCSLLYPLIRQIHLEQLPGAGDEGSDGRPQPAAAAAHRAAGEGHAAWGATRGMGVRASGGDVPDIFTH